MKAVGRSNEPRNGGGKGDGERVRVRRKVDPSSPPTTLELRGIRVHFPFKPYPCQESYMEKVLDALFRSENALLESPTGTGKTLCLLCATLAWQRQQQRSLREATEFPAEQGTTSMGAQDGPKQAARAPQIIYASRTHSQLSQVVRELRSTRYRPPHAVLASREQMCVNSKVKKKHSTASDINHDCNKLGKERKCRYRNSLEGFVPPPSEHGCSSNHQPVMDMEELIEMGKTSHVCPFYYTRGQVENAELILVPYNYLFDKDARETTLSDVRWENAVIIFDEAHNLESFASDSASFDLSNTDIAGCMNEVQRAANYLGSMPDLDYNLKEDNLARVLRAFEGLENHILSLGPQTAYGGEYMMEIFRQGAGITHANHMLFIEELRKVNDMIMDLRGTGATRGSPRLEHFVTCLKRVYGHKLEARCLAKASSYRVHVSPKTSGDKNTTGRTVSYWCFAPSLAMEELANLNVRSILVTSGTLSPLPSYSMELGLPFPHTLENPHIIGSDQVHVRVIGKGVSGKLLSSSYERRQDGEYYSELGNTLASLSRVIPAGMLIFFPSYGVMETCVERWGGPSLSRPNKPGGRNAFFAQRKKANESKQYAFPRVATNNNAFGAPSSPWRRLLAAKAIVVEPRSSADLADAISEFKRFLEMPKSSGCVLMGVCRGKISEGIDFAHDMSRAVIITGIPFAPSFDAKVKMKREFLDCAKAAAASKPSKDAGFGVDSSSGGVVPARLSGNEWYSQTAHRAVNQAIGRVIRNRSDYGSILLLDTRFDQPRNKEGLSRWVRPHVRSDEGFGAAVKALGAFYKEAKAQAQMRAESKPSPVEVAYENDKFSDDDSVSNVKQAALIKSDRPKAQNNARPDTEKDEAFIAPNRVVARVDVNDLVEKNVKEVPEIVRKPVGVRNFDAVFNQQGSSATTTSKVPKKPAALFMDKTLTLMNVRDQSTIRKLIVSMKKHGDSKDVKGFRRSAAHIIDLILKTEKHESPPLVNDARMLFLFLGLVPPAYRADFELIALQKIVQMSTLGEQCKDNLIAAECSRVFTSAVAALRLLWFGTNIEDAAFVQHAQVVVSAICKADRSNSQTMLRSFMSLLPKERHEITRRLFEDIDNAKKIEQRRIQQRHKVGESAIDMNRFLPAAEVNKRTFGRVGGPKSEELRNTSEADSKPKVVHGISAGQPAFPTKALAANRVPVNPYKRPKTKPSQAVSTIEAPPKPVHAKTTPSSLSSLLKSVEADPYVRQRKASAMGSIQSNAPSGMTCPLCSTRMSTPHIAGCGHTACLSCWKGWFKRSESCPTCRAPATLGSIAVAIFQSGLPTKSAAANPTRAANEEMDSDGELELVFDK